MNLDRLRWGEWIAAIAALDLLFVTFRSWYKVSGGGHVTGWDAFTHGKYLLIVTAVAGIFLWIVRAAEETDFPIGWLTAGIGLACTVFIAYRLASPPVDSWDADIGLYLGLASALGVTIGGLLSTRETEPAYSDPVAANEAAAPPGTYGRETPSALYGSPAATDSWSPAAPAASSGGWSPAAPAAAVPPATAAGAAGGEGGLRPGDSVTLTAGGARFPAGTVAEVVEVFAGGALVEVRAPDGMAERFEVPESAYERASGAPAGGGQSWSPAMPAPASKDWGFDESAATTGALEGTATQTDEPAGADEPKPAKTPWWKREIGGGGKKKDEDDHHLAEVGAAGAVGAAIAAHKNGAGDEKPGFFKRLFGGGGSKDEPATETLEAESTPATDVAGVGQAAESDTAVGESAVDEAPAAASEPDVAPAPAPEIPSQPEPPASATEPAAPAAPPSEPEPGAYAAPASEPEPPASAPAASEPEPTASEPPAAPSQPDPSTGGASSLADAASISGVAAAGAGAGAAAAAAAGQPDMAEEPKPTPTRKRSSGSRKVPNEAVAPAADEPEPAREPDVIVTPPEPEAASPEHEPAIADDSAPEAEAAAPADDTSEQPRRKRSSGTRKVPKEALGADAQPRVGDAVQLKVGGGKFDAGTRGTVVDVFSAGVIVELSDAEGRTERLDLPFEAIGPADA